MPYHQQRNVTAQQFMKNIILFLCKKLDYSTKASYLMPNTIKLNIMRQEM